MKKRKIEVVLGLLLTFALTAGISGCMAKANSEEKNHQDASHEELESSEHQASEHAAHKIVVTSPVRKDVVSTQPYVCQIHSCKHIEVRALRSGYLQEINVNEGQAVTKGDVMFQVVPTLYKAKLDSEKAEAQRIEIELKNADALNKKGIVSPQEIRVRTAELAKAQANVALADADLGFASVKAPFDGIVDRQMHQLGSLVEEGDVLTKLSDNSVMWVYFNVPEKNYLAYKAELDKNENHADTFQIELKLANGQIFQQPGKIGAIEADFNNTTGNIAFRADFPNPNSLLRNGQTGTILIHTVVKDAIVVPQRATFPILDKLYVYVVDDEGVVHQRYITKSSEQDDIFVIESGLSEGEKVILEGIRQVRDGDKVEFEFEAPEDVLANLKYHAE